MELEIVCGSMKDKHYMSRDLFITEWFRRAVEHKCDKLTFVMTDPPVVQLEDKPVVKSQKECSRICDDIQEYIDVINEYYESMFSDDTWKINNLNQVCLATIAHGKKVYSAYANMSDTSIQITCGSKTIKIISFKTLKDLTKRIDESTQDDFLKLLEEEFQ